MDIESITSVSLITRNPSESRRLYLSELGLPLKQLGGQYYASEDIPRCGHFGLWPLDQAAQACFGTSDWPDDVPVPQASVEFELADEASVTQAADELRAAGHELLHEAKTEPWGQIVARLLSPEGAIIGLSYAPSLHTQDQGDVAVSGERPSSPDDVPAMVPRISLLTLGVADLDRSRRFYERLGWRGQQVEDTYFVQAGGSAIALWSRARLAADANIADPDAAAGATGFGGMTMAYNVRTPEEVGVILQAALDAGATITKPAATTFYGGYAGYFADPDGHLWEVAHNPGFSLNADGSITLPDFGK